MSQAFDQQTYAARGSLDLSQANNSESNNNSMNLPMMRRGEMNGQPSLSLDNMNWEEGKDGWKQTNQQGETNEKVSS